MMVRSTLLPCPPRIVSRCGCRASIRRPPARCSLLVALFLTCLTPLTWAGESLHERIDAALDAGLVAPPVATAADHEFLRRIYLDLTGRIPTSAELRTFVAEASPDKRMTVVDQLLGSPEFIRHMTVTLDVMLMERRPDKYVTTAEWRQYLYDALAANKPLNEMFREILSADGADVAQKAPAKFLLEREAEPNLLTRDVGRMLFGIDMQCAQCHDHPLIADYEQNEYYGLFAFYQRSSLFLDPKDNTKASLGETAEGDANFKSVFTEEEGKTLPRLPGGPELEDVIFAKEDAYLVKPDKEVRGVPKYSRRKRMADEVARGDNRAFQRNVANRLWAHMMGRGLVDPVDLHHDDNPPAHPELLDLLADELANSQFDLRVFLRELALTRAYQRSIDLPQDWHAIATAAAAQVPTLEAEVATRETERNAVLAAASEIGTAASAKRDELSPQRTTLAEKRIASVEADKVARDAEAIRVSAEQQLQSKRSIIQSLNEALLAANRAAELLPAETSLTDAIAKLQAQADEVNAELKTTEDALPALQQASSSAAQAQAAAQQALLSEQTNWDQASAPLRDLEAQAAAAADQWHQAENRWILANNRLSTAREFAEALPVIDAASAARANLVAVENQFTHLQQQISTLEQQVASQQLAAQQQSLAATSTETSTTEPTSPPPSTQINTLQQQLSELSAQLEAARAQAAAADAAEAEAIGSFNEAWIRQAAAAPLKPLNPEQLAWSMMQATGVLQRQREASEAEIKQKPDAPTDPQQLAIAIEKDVNAKLEGNVPEFVRLFGGAPGQPQNVFFATVDQALFFSNGGLLASWIVPAGGNLTERLLPIDDPSRLADELYTSILTRAPTAEEVLAVRQALEAQPQDKSAVVQTLAWALLTSAEFRFSP